MKINKTNMLLAIIFEFIIILFASYGWYKASEKQNSNKISTNENYSSPSPTPDITNNDFYQSFMEKIDLSGHITTEKIINDKEQVVIIGVAKGCGSCHYNEVYIFDGENKIFTFYGEDTSLYPVEGFGFIISQPVYINEYSDKTEYQSALFLWNGKEFIKTKVSPNWVDSPQVSG